MSQINGAELFLDQVGTRLVSGASSTGEFIERIIRR
jgi:hypothetical protein